MALLHKYVQHVNVGVVSIINTYILYRRVVQFIFISSQILFVALPPLCTVVQHYLTIYAAVVKAYIYICIYIQICPGRPRRSVVNNIHTHTHTRIHIIYHKKMYRLLYSYRYTRYSHRVVSIPTFIIIH